MKKTKKSSKSIKRKRIRNNKTRRNILSMQGGSKELIGQGTHGRIYKISNSQVAKVFENRPVNSKCICSRIKELCKTTCDHIHYEYLIQRLLYNELANKTKIKIPRPYGFEIDAREKECQINMEYIYPPSNFDNSRTGGISSNKLLIQVNMAEPQMENMIPDVGLFLGISKLDLSNCNIYSPDELSFEIGKLFSYLHYVLRLDGYDCELVQGRQRIGAEDASQGANKDCIFFIDFDKVSCFEFNLGYIANRKIDENTMEPKQLDSVKKFAWFLLGGITGMSLLPSDTRMKNRFLEGYASYAPTIENGLAWQVYNKIIELILDVN